MFLTTVDFVSLVYKKDMAPTIYGADVIYGWNGSSKKKLGSVKKVLASVLLYEDGF